MDDDVHQPAWLEYPFRRFHPILRWLPLGENFGQELCIPPKRGLEWTAGELNAILESNLVPNHNGRGQLRTFWCIQWECELYSGRPKARCYPFNLSGHCFWGKNSQVFHIIWFCCTWYHIWYHIVIDILYDIMNDDVLLLAGLRGDSCTLPEQSKPGRIFQHQDRLWHSGEWSGMVCAS